MKVHRRDVLVETMTLRRSRDRHNPGLLREQPGQRELRRGRSFSLGEGLQPLHEGQVGLAVLLGEPWHDVAKIARLERRLVVNRAGQKALAQRTERYEADAEFLERRENLALRLSPPQR